MGSANSKHIWQFVFSFISLGIGNGLGMTPLVSVINHWFLKKKGNFIGMATSGGSVGGLIFPLMLRSLYQTYGFIWAIRILAFFCLACKVIAMFLVKERITRDSKSKNLLEQEEMFENKWEKIRRTVTILSFKKLKDVKFVFLISGAFCAELSLVLILTYFATYAIAQGVSESTSYLLLTEWNATDIFGRWISGYASDYWGRFNIHILILSGLNVCIFALWLPFGYSLKVLFVYASFAGFFSGSILSMLPACLGQISPVDEFRETYGLSNFFLSLGNLVGVPVGSSIINKGTVHEYNMFIILVGVLSVAGTIFLILSRYMIVGAKLNVKV